MKYDPRTGRPIRLNGAPTGAGASARGRSASANRGAAGADGGVTPRGGIRDRQAEAMQKHMENKMRARGEIGLGARSRSRSNQPGSKSQPSQGSKNNTSMNRSGVALNNSRSRSRTPNGGGMTPRGQQLALKGQGKGGAGAPKPGWDKSRTVKYGANNPNNPKTGQNALAYTAAVHGADMSMNSSMNSSMNNAGGMSGHVAAIKANYNGHPNNKIGLNKGKLQHSANVPPASVHQLAQAASPRKVNASTNADGTVTTLAMAKSSPKSMTRANNAALNTFALKGSTAAAQQNINSTETMRTNKRVPLDSAKLTETYRTKEFRENFEMK